MSLFISSLNSGSNGNCYYVGNEDEAVLIDAGISCRQVEKRLERLDLSLRKVKAIFISHEHSDHISGLVQLARKYTLPVYITPGTLYGSGLGKAGLTIRPLSGYSPVSVGQLSVTAFPKWHDAADPHSFLIECAGVRVGVFTDIGAPCEHVIRHFSQCHAAFLEANYDEEMLEQGRYPYFLKRRIQGDKGHLSNRQALDLFRRHRPVYMSHLLLSHLSKDNNCPQRVSDLFSQYADHTSVIVASRMEETPVFTVGARRLLPAE